MITERPLRRQRVFFCKCDRCKGSVGPLSRKYGKLWQAKYGESTKSFHSRVRIWHRLTASLALVEPSRDTG